MDCDNIMREIVDAAYQVHYHLGAGLLESVYEKALCYELSLRGLNFTVQEKIVVEYKGLDLGIGFRADLIVEGKVIVELKSVEALSKLHFKQLQTYLKLKDIRYGLLINFNAPFVKDSIRRVVHGY